MKTVSKARKVAALTLCILGIGPAPGKADPIGFELALVSLDRNATLDAGGSERPSISADGRYIAFQSSSRRLVGGDRRGYIDVFVRDLEQGKTELVSINRKSLPASGESFMPRVSGDGRWVAFFSTAADIGGLDPDAFIDGIYVRDRLRRQTRLVNVAIKGLANNYSFAQPDLSYDGRFVAFTSKASNLVRGDTNKVADVFVRDLRAGRTTRISLSSTGKQDNGAAVGAPTISADGRFITFASEATNLAAGDTDRDRDIFLHDRQTKKTLLVSVAMNASGGNGISSEPSLSRDGRYVAFVSSSTNLVEGGSVGQQIFVRDMQTQKTEVVSRSSAGEPGNLYSRRPALSSDGRFVAFESFASNLAANTTSSWAPQVFLRDRLLGLTELISADERQLAPSDGPSAYPTVSSDGRHVAFSSPAGLVDLDVNEEQDVYRRDRGSVCVVVACSGGL